MDCVHVLPWVCVCLHVSARAPLDSEAVLADIEPNNCASIYICTAFFILTSRYRTRAHHYSSPTYFAGSNTEKRGVPVQMENETLLKKVPMLNGR